MGILDNDTVIVDAILTKLGRDKLRQGQPLGISQYAFGDTGVDIIYIIQITHQDQMLMDRLLQVYHN